MAKSKRKAGLPDGPAMAALSQLLRVVDGWTGQGLSEEVQWPEGTWISRWAQFVERPVVGDVGVRLVFPLAAAVYTVRIEPAYIGCQAKYRQPAPGDGPEAVYRDLADGPFARETLIAVLLNIVRAEADALWDRPTEDRK